MIVLYVHSKDSCFYYLEPYVESSGHFYKRKVFTSVQVSQISKERFTVKSSF